MNLTIEPVQDTHIVTFIKRMMGANADKFDTAFAVRHRVNDGVFDTYVRKQKNRKTVALWHGQRINWPSMLKPSLTLSPVNAPGTEKPTSYGIHFVDRFSQPHEVADHSNQPSEEYMAIYEVHIGEQLDVSQQDLRQLQLTADVLKYRDSQYDSVFIRQGAGAPKSEYIVYNPAQCTVRYIVKIKA